MSRTLSTLDLPHGTLRLPVFLPDATQGVVRAVDAADLAACGVQALQMNVFHLMQHPGSSTIQALGGLHAMAGWTRPIITDSGGFQIYSLIRQKPQSGTITRRGLLFRPDGTDRKLNLTPEKSIQLQMSYGADVVICLDDCTHVDDPLPAQAESVARTIDWGRRCKAEFERRLAQSGKRPLLLAVIQGGGERDLRRRCAEELLEIGFDGFGFGGWPLDAQGHLLTDILATVRELVPPEFPLHALGVGHPANIAECARLGYSLFDSTLPTRDARHGRLYVWNGDPRAWSGPTIGEAFSYIYVADNKHIKAAAPLSGFCNGPCCSAYSLGYLHHLYKIGDSLFMRLATIHNLRFMMQLMEALRSRQNA
jgi:queuine tRNA-ribosyltransferase